MSLSAIALRGLDEAYARFERAAVNLSAIAAPPPEPQSDTVELSDAVVSLLSARNDFAANIKVLETAGEMQRAAVELFAPDPRDLDRH